MLPQPCSAGEAGIFPDAYATGTGAGYASGEAEDTVTFTSGNAEGTVAFSTSGDALGTVTIIKNKKR